MNVIALSAKALIAVLLLAAGGAKLADLPGFTAAVALFVPGRVPRQVRRGTALGVAIGEIAAGAASLSSPGIGWLNPVVFGIGCGFLGVSVVGYAWHRDRPCHCFGALSTRTFSPAGIGRAVLIVAGAAAATVPARSSLIQLGPGGRLALLGGAALVAWAAFSAAAAVAAGRDAVPRWAS